MCMWVFFYTCCVLQEQWDVCACLCLWLCMCARERDTLCKGTACSTVHIQPHLPDSTPPLSAGSLFSLLSALAASLLLGLEVAHQNINTHTHISLTHTLTQSAYYSVLTCSCVSQKNPKIAGVRVHVRRRWCFCHRFLVAVRKKNDKMRLGWLLVCFGVSWCHWHTSKMKWLQLLLLEA